MPIVWPCLLTNRCRESLDRATRFACWHGGGTVLPAHALIGILDEGTGVAAGVIEAAGVEVGRLRCGLTLKLRGDRRVPKRLPEPVPAASLLQLLDRASNVSASMFNHRYVGTEHLFLALLEASLPLVNEALEETGQTTQGLKKRLFEMLGMEPPDAGGS